MDVISKTSTVISMRREGQFCCVDASCENILRNALQTRFCQSCQNPDGTLLVKRRRQTLYERESYGGEPVLKFWCGLLPAAHNAFQQAGVSIKFRGGSYHANLPLPPREIKFPDRPFIEHVAKHDRGLIRYNAEGVSPIHLIVQVARAWPKLHITVIASRRNDVINIAKQLRAAKIDAFGFTGQNQPWVEAKVAVCTFAGMAYNPTEVEKQNIVIVLAAVEAISKEPRWCLEHAIDARLFGFLDIARPLSPYEEDMVRSLFGFDELLVAWSGCQLRPVEVAWAPSEGRQLSSEPEDDLGLKRHALWRRDPRNRQVARVAKAFAAGDQKTLATLLLRQSSPECWAAPRNTFVVVENIEHALKLLPKLPGWSILAAGLANLDGLSAEQQAAIRQPRSFLDESAPCGIVTHGGMRHQQMPWKKVDVVIRADGGTNLPDLPVVAQVQGAAEQALRPLLLVDFEDDHHPKLQRRAMKRWKAYCENGWLPAGIDATCLRIGEFLRTRRDRGRKGGRP